MLHLYRIQKQLTKLVQNFYFFSQLTEYLPSRISFYLLREEADKNYVTIIK